MPSAKTPVPRFSTMRDIFDALCRPGASPCINLAAGMVELPPPARLTELASELFLKQRVAELSSIENPHMYRSRLGDAVFAEAVQLLQERLYTRDTYSLDKILVTNGVSGAVSSTLAMIAGRPRGERPLRCGLFVPFYTYHLEAIRTMLPVDTEIVYMPLQDDMSFDFERLEQEAPALDFVAFSNPGNPSCHALTELEVREFERIAAANPSMIVFSDEIYADIMYDGKFHTFGPSSPSNILVARGFSKILSIGSWRLAYVLGHLSTLREVATAHDRIFVGANITQMAVGLYIRDHFDEFLEHIRTFNATLCENADLIIGAFEAHLGWTAIPGQGSMYRLIRHDRATDDEAFDLLVKQCGIAVVPGSLLAPSLGDKVVGDGEGRRCTGYLRIHVGFSTEKARQVCDRLALARG
ncbi:hypothetical protein HDU89_006643 [Geranomyces variabilis]|nr:hypothetical protein HDU89_006643 [Geranomyces variabilis]